jgi:hypothetical protein
MEIFQKENYIKGQLGIIATIWHNTFTWGLGLNLKNSFVFGKFGLNRKITDLSSTTS